MRITNSSKADIDVLFEIYDLASAYKLKVGNKGWKGFEVTQVEKEIQEGRHYTIWEGMDIACTFVLTYDDEVIWHKRGKDRAVYIHRIATNPQYRGGAYVKKILAWVKQLAISQKLDFIRLDTHSGNEKLNRYYEECGFEFKGISHIVWEKGMPEHYKEGSFSLFEIVIADS